MSLLEKLIYVPDPADLLDQGQIFDNLNFPLPTPDLASKGVLVTPVCDIRNNKNIPYLFCYIGNFETAFPALVKSSFRGRDFVDAKTDSDFRSDIVEKFLDGFIGGKFGRHQWLGELPNNPGKHWYVDFAISKILYKDEISLENRIASVASPLREAIPTRYASMMNRVGLPVENAERKVYANELLDYILQ